MSARTVMNEIRYDLSIGDYFRSTLFFLHRRAFLIVLFVGCFLLIFLQSIRSVPSEERDGLFIAVAFLVSFAPCIAGYLAMLLYCALRFISYRRSGYWGRRTVTLSPDGITSERDAGSSFTRWSDVLKIYSTKKLIMIGLASGIALVVPKRAFPGEAEAAEFLDRVKRYKDGLPADEAN
jgi:hypothetical protein